MEPLTSHCTPAFSCASCLLAHSLETLGSCRHSLLRTCRSKRRQRRRAARRELWKPAPQSARKARRGGGGVGRAWRLRLRAEAEAPRDGADFRGRDRALRALRFKGRDRRRNASVASSLRAVVAEAEQRRHVCMLLRTPGSSGSVSGGAGGPQPHLLSLAGLAAGSRRLQKTCLEESTSLTGAHLHRAQEEKRRASRLRLPLNSSRAAGALLCRPLPDANPPISCWQTNRTHQAIKRLSLQCLGVEEFDGILRRSPVTRLARDSQTCSSQCAECLTLPPRQSAASAEDMRHGQSTARRGRTARRAEFSLEPPKTRPRSGPRHELYGETTALGRPSTTVLSPGRKPFRNLA